MSGKLSFHDWKSRGFLLQKTCRNLDVCYTSHYTPYGKGLDSWVQRVRVCITSHKEMESCLFLLAWRCHYWQIIIDIRKWINWSSPLVNVSTYVFYCCGDRRRMLSSSGQLKKQWRLNEIEASKTSVMSVWVTDSLNVILMACINDDVQLLIGNPSQTYGASPAKWDHTAWAATDFWPISRCVSVTVRDRT